MTAPPVVDSTTDAATDYRVALADPYDIFYDSISRVSTTVINCFMIITNYYVCIITIVPTKKKQTSTVAVRSGDAER